MRLVAAIGNMLQVIASQDGLLQLNAYEPVVAVAIMDSQGLFFKTIPLFRKSCVEGITVNEDVLKRHIEQSVGIVTALNPVLLRQTTELAKNEDLERDTGTDSRKETVYRRVNQETSDPVYDRATISLNQ
jgi:aspartate ammonia-lyase